MSITPRQVICPRSKWSIKCPYTMNNPVAITVHNTGNRAPAINEINYMNSNNNQVSFHFAVDDKEVVQGLPLNRNGWHAGDGANGPGNRTTIAVEICYSLDGGPKFDKAEALAAKFIAQLLHERGWGIDKLTKHQDYALKYCPQRTLDYGWDRFKGMVQSELNALNKPVIEWVDQEKKSYVVVQETHLVNVATGSNVRTFAVGVGLDFVQHCTYKGKAYYRTQWSKDNNVDNGVPVLDVAEVKPAPAPVKWEKAINSPLTKVALRDCALVDLHTKEIIKEYVLGTEISGLVEYAKYGDSEYYRLEADKKNGKDYGIEAHQLGEVPPKEPETPAKPAKPADNEDIPKPAEPVEGDKAPNWFVKFITAIADFIKNFFSKEK